MQSLIALIIALLEAVPIAKKFVDSLLTIYIQRQIDVLHENDRAAIRQALVEHDQRAIEWQLGNSNSGEPSFLPGTHVVDSVAGVVPSTQKKRSDG